MAADTDQFGANPGPPRRNGDRHRCSWGSARSTTNRHERRPNRGREDRNTLTWPFDAHLVSGSPQTGAFLRHDSAYGVSYSQLVDEVSVWRLVEDARSEMGAVTELVSQALLRRLRTLRPNAIERFQELWELAQDEL